VYTLIKVVIYLSKPYAGKQLWIWELSQCGTPSVVVELAKGLNCTGILVKAWDGSNYINWLPQLQQISTIAHSAGLLVGAWGYSYGSNIAGEVLAMEEAVNSGKADWLVIDAELEYEAPEGQQMALDLFVALQSSNVGYAGCAYTSFGLPADHTTFPWKTFSKNCFCALPQVYFGDFNLAPNTAVEQSISQYSAYGISAAPVGQAYNDTTSTVTGAELTTFGRTAYQLGCPGVSFWSLQAATYGMLEGIRSI
jgi:hypothetical protein